MLITIIVPVYNAEAYIHNCTNSISNQTHQNWECILIDDGSTDNSLAILKDIQKRDNRFITIHQANSGAGIARNHGLMIAKGKYVVFIDSDDTIERNYLELLCKHDEDVVFVDVNNISEKGELIRIEGASQYAKLSKDDIIRRQLTGLLPWGGWRKAAKIDLLNKYRITFSNQHIGEEAQYSFKLLYYASSIGYIHHPVYNHIIRIGSLSQSHDEDPWGGLVPLFIEDVNIYELLEKNEYLDALNLLNFRALIICLERLAARYPYREYKAKAKTRLKIYKKYIIKGVGYDSKQIGMKTKLLYKILQFNNSSLLYFYNKLKRLL